MRMRQLLRISLGRHQQGQSTACAFKYCTVILTQFPTSLWGLGEGGKSHGIGAILNAMHRCMQSPPGLPTKKAENGLGTIQQIQSLAGGAAMPYLQLEPVFADDDDAAADAAAALRQPVWPC